ncbi:MAG TPA: helix-turn-helix domain-containing protein [Conexibacter sp.]|nr:helix-turn-helix domain-containing protein [Conexibacter sp.]
MRRTGHRDDSARRALAALSHPIRTRILDYLQVHDRASPGELATAFGIPLGTVSYHVRRLETLGYLRLVRRVPRRGAIEHFYAPAGTHDPERVVAQLAGRFLTTPETKLSTRALLDATAIAELHVDLDRLFRRARELESQTVARAGIGGGRTFPVHVVCVVDAGGSTAA